MNENRPPMTWEQLLETMNGDAQAARAIWDNWHRNYPDDPDEIRRYTNKAHRYETAMRGLNTDLATGRITREQYFEKMEKLKREIFG